jgi:hypothetical protein
MYILPTYYIYNYMSTYYQPQPTYITNLKPTYLHI